MNYLQMGKNIEVATTAATTTTTTEVLAIHNFNSSQPDHRHNLQLFCHSPASIEFSR